MKIKIDIEFDTREEIAMVLTVLKLDEDGEWYPRESYDFAYVTECTQFISGYLCALNSLEGLE